MVLVADCIDGELRNTWVGRDEGLVGVWRKVRAGGWRKIGKASPAWDEKRAKMHYIRRGVCGKAKGEQRREMGGNYFVSRKLSRLKQTREVSIIHKYYIRG